MAEKTVLDDIQVDIASIEDAEEILQVQKEAFEGQAEIYDNYKLPP